MNAPSAGAPRRKVFIETYGCQMNVYDSQRMRDMLAPLGYAPAESAQDADLLILNTCHIREKATEKVYSELGRWREATAGRAEKPTIAVAGCVAQAEGEEILARAPVVDFVVGPQSYHRLPELIAKAARARGERVAAEFAAEEKFDALPAPRAHGPSAYLSIQEGCDHFCTFCVVPYTRGAEFSRPAAAVLAEARALTAQGVREITLLGQNVNGYHGAGLEGGEARLEDLLAELAKLPELARLRYATSHPLEMSDALIALHGENEKLAPYLHLPVQSGSSRILKAMNRKHDRDFYLRIVERLRAARADIALSTDFIVGFPGETEKDFEDTLSLAREAGFASAYSFMYSPRPGTPAGAMTKQTPDEEKRARLHALQEVLGESQKTFNASKVGQILPVLVTEAGRKPGQMMGKSPYMQSVHFDAESDIVGQIVPVRIVAASQNSLTGALAL